jgi:NAD(P)H-hydrate epimerase
VKIATVQEMRAMDRTAMRRYGIPAEILIENAGEAVYFVVLEEFGIVDQRFLVLCGAGHNGGDGMVAARKLHSSGGGVAVCLFADPEQLDPVSKINFEMIRKAGVPVQVRPELESIRAAIDESEVVIDALLGTGIDREVRGACRGLIDALNRCDASVVSIDIPSGVDGNSGKV